MKDHLYRRFMDDFNLKIEGKTILEWGKSSANDDNEAFMVGHPGTLFKLFSLYAYLKFPYLHIISNQKRLHKERGLGYNIIYVDLFAGNGLNKIKLGNLEYYICGSPILSLLASYALSREREYECYFDKMILIDRGEKSIQLLKNRLDLMLGKLKISKLLSVEKQIEGSSRILTIRGDISNEGFMNSITDTIDRTWQNGLIHTMLYADPASPENLSAYALRNFLRYPGDLMILLHPGIFAEMVK